MSFSNSVTRCYTPPTCTLEISAKDSPLTRWMGRSVLKHLRFKLSFDDPRVSDDRWITVRGDRAQIEALSQVVATYVQQFLNQSTTLLNTAHSGNGTSSNLSQSTTASTLSVLSRSTPQNSPAFVEANPARISIQPSGILSHELFLGTLATEESGASLRLSAVQLADLASALDEYAADVTAIPTLNRPAWSKASPQWTSVAATALIAFGLTASVLRMLDRPSQPAQNVATSSQGASSSDQRLAVQPLPSSPSPSPSALLPTAPPPLISLNPPAPTSTTPPATTGDLPKITVLPAPPANSVPVEPPPGITIQPAPSGDRATNYPVSPVPNSIRSAKRSAPTPPVASQNAGSEAQASIAQSSALRANSSPESSRPLDKNTTAFDTIPQVAEVRQFFQKRWKPRPELTEQLQYNLTLNADGSIRSADALTQLAGDYIDRTGMPPWNESFVSPLESGGSSVIRVVLSPDGTVQTFLQSVNNQ